MPEEVNKLESEKVNLELSELPIPSQHTHLELMVAFMEALIQEPMVVLTGALMVVHMELLMVIQPMLSDHNMDRTGQWEAHSAPDMLHPTEECKCKDQLLIDQLMLMPMLILRKIEKIEFF